MTFRLPRKRKHAFTLVEVSLAMLIVAVGMIGVITVLPAGSQSGREAREDTAAAMVAQAILDDVRGYLLRGGVYDNYAYRPSHMFINYRTAGGQIRNYDGPHPMHRNDFTLYGDSHLGAFRLNIVPADFNRDNIKDDGFNVSLDFFRGNYFQYEGVASTISSRARRFAIQVRKP